jgi:hypothetical protein
MYGYQCNERLKLQLRDLNSSQHTMGCGKDRIPKDRDEFKGREV